MQAFPKKHRANKPKLIAECPEASLQAFADDYYDAMGIKNIRIPATVFNWINYKAPIWFKIFFNKMFGGYPDNLLLFPYGKYQLAVAIELKTQTADGQEVGKLHGKQKPNSKNENWIICRSPEQVIKAVDEIKQYIKETQYL